MVRLSDLDVAMIISTNEKALNEIAEEMNSWFEKGNPN